LNQLIQDALRKIFTGFGALSMDAQCPVILVGHCNVTGAELSTGQTLLGQDIMVSKHDLDLARADYYALGHIHKAQESGPRIFYSGSIYHCNFGEVEKKSFNFVKISIEKVPARSFQRFGGTEVPDSIRREINIDQIEIPSRPLSLHELNWDEESGPHPMFWDPKDTCDWEGAELRVRINATKEKQALITDAEIESRYRLAHSYQIERIIIPEERIRSSEIVKAKTLPEKVVEWGRSIDKEISPEVLRLADVVERSVIS
jgi:DNA repair exonuclease SbcCD nuclease subunit